MQHADVGLRDDAIILAAHQALAHRDPIGLNHGRPELPVVLRY
jgi:hypothetical protein